MGIRYFLFAFALPALVHAQEPPKRPSAPPEVGRLPPVEEPYVSPVRRDDLLQQFTPRSPLQGIYALRDRVDRGLQIPGMARGYLVVGRRFMSLHLVSDGVIPNVPMIRSGFRSYTLVGEQLHMTTLVGHFNDIDGNIKVERQGRTEVRRYQIVGSLLRIYQDDKSYLEFSRIE